MSLSDEEFKEMVDAAADNDEPSLQASWALGLRLMLDAIAELDYSARQESALSKLCDAGARYGLRQLQCEMDPRLWRRLSRKARESLRRDLRRNLVRLTRPSFELERTSFGLALTALGSLEHDTDGKVAERMFLGRKPGDRLSSLFRKFPVLARLWFQLISQWRGHITEVITRFTLDRSALSRAFFGGRPVGKISDLRLGLSDSHNNGRTVVRLQLEEGPVIYKPRSGIGEWEWFSLLNWMNSRSFQPKLRAARVLPRKGYCWMEQVEPASCENEKAARRFYQRMGGMIAAAYLIRAVDCHRDNVIAVGEYPILVDVDALWHVSPVTKTQSLANHLYRTGFFPDSNRRSLLSRSSALGPGTTGHHRARVASRSLKPADYEREITSGFAKAWRCILGTKNRRHAFAGRLRRICSRERRWIYWATEKYVAIRQASIQPVALRSGTERDLLIVRLCTRATVTSALVDGEVHDLKQLDIPYFVRKSSAQVPSDPSTLPLGLIKAIQRGLGAEPSL